MPELNDTRRRFIAHFAGAGLGATLAPGIIWGKMQEQGTDRITLEMVTGALKLAGIESTEAERQAMVNGAKQAWRAMRPSGKSTFRTTCRRRFTSAPWCPASKSTRQPGPSG
jgi:hypothetical protein